MKAAAPSTGFRLLELQAHELHRRGDLLEQLFGGQLLGAIIRRTFEPELLAGVVSSLQAAGASLPLRPVEHYRGSQLGRTLVIEPGSLDAYFTEAARMREVCASSFSACGGFETVLQTTLGALASGATIAPPRSANGHLYGPSTIRVLGAGAAIDLHCEEETRRFPAMKELDQTIDLSAQLSFYVSLALPSAGGQLRISSARHGDPRHRLESRDRRSAQTLELVDGLEFVVADVGVGDLLIFDAGRHYHRVTEVQGDRARWTMGGFLARSRDRSTVHYWA